MFIAPHETAAAAATPAERYEAIGRFYADHARVLVRRVVRRVSDRARAEDGCQAAWTALLSDERIPLDHHGLAWLEKVAVRAARRGACERERPVGTLSGDGEGEWELREPCGTTRGPLQRVLDTEAQEEAWARLRALTARQRRLVGLQALGLSYADVAAVTGDSLRTVERQVLRARGKLRAGGDQMVS